MGLSRHSAGWVFSIAMFTLAGCAGAPEGATPPPAGGNTGGSSLDAASAAGGTGGAPDASGGSGGSGGSPEPSPPPPPPLDSGTAPDSADGSGATAQPVQSPLCATGAPMPAPSGAQTIQATGKSRRFILRVPPAYDGKRPFPVLFAFHGAGGGAAGFETGAFGGVSRMAAERAIRVFPEALGGTWSRDEADDVLFFDAIVQWLTEQVCFDGARIFASGQSSGAYFANRVGCNRGGVIRAIATNSGGQRREYPLGPCKAPVAAWLSNGASDNPGHVMGTQWARDEWLKTNGCTPGMPLPTSPSPCVAYPGCPEEFPVHYCQHPGGHALPGYAAGGITGFLLD